MLQHGNRLTVRGPPGSSDSPLTMDREVDGHVATGPWTEQTATEGYYRGARYHGAIQLLVEPAGRRMTGKWVGFGKEFDVNPGPWELVFQDASTTKATLEAYNRRPDARSRAHDGAPLTGRGGRARERVVFMGTGGAGGHVPWAAESGARWVQGRGAPSRRQTRASRSPGGGVGDRTRRCGSRPSVLFGGEVIGGAGRAGWSPEGEDWRYG